MNVTEAREVGKRWRPPATSDEASNPLDNAQADPTEQRVFLFVSRLTMLGVPSPSSMPPTTTTGFYLCRLFRNELLTLIAALSPFTFFVPRLVILNPAFSRAVTTS